MKIALCLNNISIFRQTYSFSLPFVTKEGGRGSAVALFIHFSFLIAVFYQKILIKS